MRLCHEITVALRNLLRGESGPTATEYAIMLGLIVLVAAASVRAIGEKMDVLYQIIDSAVTT